MRRTSLLIATFAALALALAPGLADARAGSSSSGGASMGSRGSRTYSAPPSTGTAPGVATPMQRSVTPAAPSSGAPGMGPAGFAGPRSGFMSGLMGGLIGAGIGGLLFGHGLFGGMVGFGGFLGLLIQIFLIVMVMRFLIRFFLRRAQPAFAGPQAMPRQAMPGAMPGGGAGQPAINIQPADYAAFEQLLGAVQAAWSRHDVNALGGLATPEMASYFAEQMAGQVSRGVHNVVSEVRLLQGDLAEAWAEPGREYATVAMRFSMIDVTSDAAGRVVDGSATEHVEATEVWTFVRAPGGTWLLSAIQQAR